MPRRRKELPKPKEIADTVEKARNSIDTAIRSYYQIYTESIQSGLRLKIAEALAETAYLLNLELPPFALFMDFTEDGYKRQGYCLKINDVLHVALDGRYLLELRDIIRQTGELNLAELYITLAHEMYHVYVRENFPKTAQKNIQANLEGGEAYHQSRGEQAAMLFAQQYLLLKLEQKKQDTLVDT